MMFALNTPVIAGPVPVIQSDIKEELDNPDNDRER
jgi:hypothetical protein